MRAGRRLGSVELRAQLVLARARRLSVGRARRIGGGERQVRRDVRVEEAARALRGRKDPPVVGPRVLGKVEAPRLVERAYAEVVLRGGQKG